MLAHVHIPYLIKSYMKSKDCICWGNSKNYWWSKFLASFLIGEFIVVFIRCLLVFSLFWFANLLLRVKKHILTKAWWKLARDFIHSREISFTHVRDCIHLHERVHFLVRDCIYSHELLSNFWVASGAFPHVRKHLLMWENIYSCVVRAFPCTT